MNLPTPIRLPLATLLVSGLAVAVAAGVLWAYNPDDGGEITFRPDQIPLATPSAPAVTAAAEDTAPEDAEPASEDLDPSPRASATPDVEALLAAAPEPGETTVQVLDAGGGARTTAAVADRLSELGYRVTNVTSARARVERTTVWFTEGQEPAARAMRAREPRVAEVEPNRALNEGTHVHVLVGPDWS